jgi:hypothetical protein
MKDWKVHGYKNLCNVFLEIKHENTHGLKEGESNDLRKYGFFLERYMDHKESRKNIKKLREDIEMNLIDHLITNLNYTIVEV